LIKSGLRLCMRISKHTVCGKVLNEVFQKGRDAVFTTVV